MYLDIRHIYNVHFIFIFLNFLYYNTAAVQINLQNIKEFLKYFRIYRMLWKKKIYLNKFLNIVSEYCFEKMQYVKHCFNKLKKCYISWNCYPIWKKITPSISLFCIIWLLLGFKIWGEICQHVYNWNIKNVYKFQNSRQRE